MTSGPGDAVVEDQEEPPAPAEGTLAHQILYGSATDVKLRAQEWASLCSRDLAQALLVVLDLTLALSGLPGAVTPEDLEAGWVGVDQRGVGEFPAQAEPALLVIRLPDWLRNGAALLDSHLVTSLSRWLLVLHAAAIRSVRHVSTIAALSVAEALGHQYHALSRSHETLSRQLQTVTGNVTARQEAQLKRDVGACFSHAREMSRARNQLLETIVPLRSRDISEVIRVYTLSQVDRLMKVDPEMYLQNKWTARVFLMVHDPHVEVRLKALSVIMQWFLPDKKKSAAEHLGQFAKNCLPHLVERVGDVEPRVAQMALRCLRQKDLAENLKSEEFELVVNLVIGSRDMAVREEAALFADPQQELYNSEVAISMLIEYIDEYMKDRLRICERLVGAFWPRSPALSHWSTMVNLCMAAVRRADDEVRTARPSEKDNAATRMNEACMHIIPEIPRLMDLCRPEETQEDPRQTAQSQVLVNSKVLCQGLRKAIEDLSPMETMKNSADSLLALARCFEEAKNTFLDLSKEVHRACSNILEDEKDTSFGSMPMVRRMLKLLHERVELMKAKRKQGEDIKDEPPSTPRREEAGPARKRRRQQALPAPAPQAPDVRLTLQLLEAVILSVMWHVRTTYWVQSQGNSEEGRRNAENQVSEMLQGFSELAALRAELPRMMSEVRHCCAELVESDLSPYVQFHAYSAYMTLIQLCVGVSETLSLEVDEKGRPVRAGWGRTYEVTIPKAHLEALYKYLNHLYIRVTEADITEGVSFNAEGHRILPYSIYPAPSQNIMTSVRYLTLRTMQTPGTDPEVSGLVLRPEPADELLFAVLASRCILESELQDVYTGPLGLLLLTQCEKARPKPLREVRGECGACAARTVGERDRVFL
eukprot:g15304.t1